VVHQRLPSREAIPDWGERHSWIFIPGPGGRKLGRHAEQQSYVVPGTELSYRLVTVISSTRFGLGMRSAMCWGHA
jgi:hypothetical protein